jgi:hypothetical protein
VLKQLLLLIVAAAILVLATELSIAFTDWFVRLDNWKGICRWIAYTAYLAALVFAWWADRPKKS